MVKVYRVDRVNGIARGVEIKAGNVVLQFIRKGKKIKLYGKYKPGSRVLDYAQLDVPKALFAQASQMAAAILFRQAKQKKLSSQRQQMSFNF
jgi:hypothetical protein